MKKLASMLLALALVLSMVCCASAEGTIELALITDSGTIDDKSFNQGCYEGMQQYAEENGKEYNYYKPTEFTTDGYLAQIDIAVQNGAKMIICPGFMFAEALGQAQQIYPNVSFVIVDSAPTVEGVEQIDANVLSVMYAEEQSGFLAGYAAVKDGYTKLGFMGGMAVPAVIRFGKGFAQGAETAAAELGLTDIELMYHYTGSFDATPEAQTLAASWYEAGTEVIFACGGSVGNSVMSAAEAAGKAVIGVDGDQSGESETVITSAMKGVSASVYEAVTEFYDGTFEGGRQIICDAANGGVQLPMASSRFKTFSQEDYDALFAKVVSGEYAVNNSTDDMTPGDLGLTIVKTTVVE